MQWLKVDTAGWLRGSIRKQLTMEQRSVWIDLLVIASDCRIRDGSLRYGEGVPMTRKDIASALHIPVEVLDATITACQKDKNEKDSKKRIEIWDDGTIQIMNWDRYQAVPPGKQPLDAEEREKMEKWLAYKNAKKHPKEAIAGVNARTKGKILTIEPEPKPGDKPAPVVKSESDTETKPEPEPDPVDNSILGKLTRTMKDRKTIAEQVEELKEAVSAKNEIKKDGA